MQPGDLETPRISSAALGRKRGLSLYHYRTSLQEKKQKDEREQTPCSLRLLQGDSGYDSPMKMIAFVIPNETSRKKIFSFAVSVDHAEELTGLDFFSGLEDSLEDHLESSVSFDLWQ